MMKVEGNLSLTAATELAAQAHAGQTDMDGHEHILHVMRVTATVAEERGDQAGVVAVLHDVLEDTALDSVDLRSAGISEAQIKALHLLTNYEGSDRYEEYIERLTADYIEAEWKAAQRLALAVKKADLEDNLARSTEAGREKRAAKYTAALKKVNAALKG